MRALAPVGLVIALHAPAARAQTVDALDPHVRAVATTAPPSVRLEWQPMAGVQSFTVLRWNDQTSRWDTLASSLAASATRYEDTRVEAGRAYEYEVRALSTATPPRNGRAYVLAGLDAPFRDDRGVALVLVDAQSATALQEPLARFVGDLARDGWDARQETVAPDDAPPAVKARIQRVYDENPERLRAVILLGAVPRAFSGRINPDGHADHLGAWPADGYYADLDAEWSDDADLGGVGAFANRRGDGRFDHSVYPSLLDVPVGRIDPVDLPAFAPVDGATLLRRYLDRNHAFREGALAVSPRTWVSDSFGYFNGEAFARVAWRTGVPLTGADPLRGRPFFEALDDAGGYLFALGVGAGSPTSAAGVGTTSDFVRRSPRAIFVGLFGSYFGDWSYRDNLLRAALLGPGHVLAAMWTARPYAQLHALGALRSVGECFLDTANNEPGRYEFGSAPRSVHQALLGDPTLRLFTTTPPSNVRAEVTPAAIRLRWDEAPEGTPSQLPATRAGYHVYRRDAPHDAETRLTPEPVTAAAYADPSAPRGTRVTYRVVTVERITTGSGTFYNHSLGAMFAATRPDDPPVTQDASVADVALPDATASDASTAPPAAPGGCACTTRTSPAPPHARIWITWVLLATLRRRRARS